MKNTLIASLLMLFAITSFAQNDLKQQIISFTDSTEMIIRNGRKLVVEKVTTSHHEEAIQTMEYMKKNVAQEYVVFLPVEELLISLATSNFDKFLFVAANYHSLLDDKTKSVQMEEITNDLHTYLSQELPLIKKDLQASKILPAEKDFIQIYLDFYERKDKMEVNKSIKNYLKTYPDSPYSKFLTDLKTYTTTGYMNICIGYGHEFINGNISNAFNSNFQIMQLEIDWFVNQLYLSFFFNGSVSKIITKQDLPLIPTNLTQNKGSQAFSLKYGVKMGHSVFTNKTFNVFPYLSFGGYQMNAEKSNLENIDPNEKYKLVESFFTGVGTSCDITLKNINAAHTTQKIGYVIIRPTIGYDFFVTKKETSKGQSFYMLVSMGIGFGG